MGYLNTCMHKISSFIYKLNHSLCPCHFPGLIEGHKEVGAILEHGDFGLGTLSMLDGEVTILNGEAYKQEANGNCTLVPNSALSPFMMVTFFQEQDATYCPISEVDWNSLRSTLRDKMPSSNVFAAIKVIGDFKYLKLRAVKKQERNRPLLEVAQEQQVYEMTNESGYLVGFWTPQIVGHSLSVPGFHLHYLSTDKSKGGHVLDLQMHSGEAWIQSEYAVHQDFPQTNSFANADFSEGDIKGELEKAEG